MSTSDSGPTGPESSSPTPVRTCPHCGAVLPADAPEGQCPACLLLNLTLEPTAVPPTLPAEPPRPPSPPLTPAELAPHFPQLEILECLGRGGMGVVYKARQKSLNRLVALKLLAPEREKDAAFAERFTREAQALALLSHSHIVTVYDFGATSPSTEGTGDGFYYLLMEYVDGVNLRQLLDQRKLTAEEALAIVPPLCDALEYAHERGIVHRDIKPENLLLDRRGQVKIADFGIAKMLGNGTPYHTMEGTPVEPVPLGVTQPETALGTPAYMAPEQASAPERVDSRADIYSLGVVFYEMLTGELPAKQIEASSSRLKNLHIDVRVDEIVLRALEKKPEMRWQTAAELRTRVEEVSSATHAPPPPPLPTEVSDSAPKVRPFHPWMQRFVARSFEGRRALFWCMLVAGTLLTALFMMPVSKHRADPTPWFQLDPNSRMVSKDDWLVRGEFGVPDAWWSETVRQSTVPVTNANGKVVGRTISQASQVEREVHFFTLSYALGAVAGILWILFWCFLSAEQRAGDALPPAQRAFAMTMVDRSLGTRILWGHILLLFLAFVGTSVALSGHMTAFMMLLLGDGPNPILNAFFTTFILSFVFAKGLGVEIAGEKPAAGRFAVPEVSGGNQPFRAAGRVAVAVGLVTAFALPFLIYMLNEMMSGRVKDRFLIAAFLVTWGVSAPGAHWLLTRGKLSESATRLWLRVTSICGWLVSLPVVGFAIFTVLSAAGESGSWNPAPAEAFMVPAFWLGAVLLPVASWYLWRASGPRPGLENRPGRRLGRVALGVFMLLAALVVPLVHLASYSISRAQDQANYARQRNLLQQRAIVEQANLDHLQGTVGDLRAQQQSTQSPVEKAQIQEKLATAHRAIASAQESADASLRELQTLVGPPVGPIFSGGLGYLILGSAACVAAAILLFRRSKSPEDWYPRLILPVLLVVTLGYVMFAVTRFYVFASSYAGEFGRVEIPFAYNSTVRGNVLVVTLTAKVGHLDLELRPLLHGRKISPHERQLADRAYGEPKAFPEQTPAQQPKKNLYPGANMVELAFAFPDEATARHAGGNLRPVGILSPGPGRVASGVLFQIHTQEHGMYQGEIQFSRASGFEMPAVVEAATSGSDEDYNGVVFRGTVVERRPGTREIQLHFTRSDQTGLGLETAQDINLSPEGRGPAVEGSPGWKMTNWVGRGGPHVLTWTLPTEFSEDDMERLVGQLKKDWLKKRRLPEGGVPMIGRLTHRDGWTCTLLARVLQQPTADISMLRSNLKHWRENRKNMAVTYLPNHPALREIDERIAATETVIRALKEYPNAVSAATDPPIMDTSDAALRTLSWQTFDQTPGQYWRQLADVRRFREAAELIERYLTLHPELEEAAQQIYGANLHFHAAQCHASARNTEKALEHLQRSRYSTSASNQDNLPWNSYVDATKYFLLGDREYMLLSYDTVASRSTFNHPNLITLDHLLAGFGKPYAEACEIDTNANHKQLSTDFFNRTWELLDRRSPRSPEEDVQMLSYAHASLAHWRQREDCQTKNISIGYWQISRVYAVQGDGISALRFALLCSVASAKESPYYLGYAYEALARAALVNWWTTGPEVFRKNLERARAQAALVTDDDDRKMLEKDLNELEASKPPTPSAAQFPTTTRTIKLTFATPHSQKDIEGWMNSMLCAHESCQISPDKHSFTITAAPEGMHRALACLESLDSTEPIRPLGDGPRFTQYFCDTPANTARAFLHACALRDYDAMASLMDPAELGRLKDPKIGARLSFLRPYLNLSPEEFAKIRAKSPDDVPEDLHTAWETLEGEVRSDWPGKREALKKLSRQFLQYPVATLSLNATSAEDLAVVHVNYEGTAPPVGAICISPQIPNHFPEKKWYQVSRCMPPETKASAGSIFTE